LYWLKISIDLSPKVTCDIACYWSRGSNDGREIAKAGASSVRLPPVESVCVSEDVSVIQYSYD
jgi:hypothetical protein